MTPEEQAYKEVHDATEAASLSGTVEQTSAATDVDQPQPHKPRQKIKVRCQNCKASTTVLLREGHYTEEGARQMARFYERSKCGNCGARDSLTARCWKAPRNWFQRLWRMK